MIPGSLTPALSREGRGCFFHRQPRLRTRSVARNDPFKRPFCFLSLDSGNIDLFIQDLALNLNLAV